MNKPVEHLITQHLDIWTQATEAKSTAGRGTRGKINLLGIQKLRELILEMAVRGLLVPQDPNDEPASELLKKIAAEKAQLIKDGKIKKTKPLPDITDDEKPFELPKGWAWVRLGDVTNYGQTLKAEPKDVNADTWVLELEDVEKVTSKLIQKNSFLDKPFKSSKNRFEKGDVIYGKLRPYLDKVLVADDSGVCTTEMIPVRGYCSIHPEYLRLVLKAPYFIEYANSSTHGMNLPRLGTDKARLALFPLVLESEQTRIVAKVDELMALCDALETQTLDSIATHQTLVNTLLGNLVNLDNTARSHVPRGNADLELAENTDMGSHAERGNQLDNQLHQAFTPPCGVWLLIEQHFDVLFTTEHSIDTLKQTILQLAVMGKLVPQDPNDEPASELLKKIAAEKAQLIKDGKIKKSKPLPDITDDEKPFKLPRGWGWVRLGDLIPQFQNGASSRGDKDGQSVVVFRLADIKNWEISLADTRELLISNDSIEKYSIQIGDILIIRVNGSADIVGRFIVSQLEYDAIYCDHFIRMRFPLKVIEPNYLKILGASSLVRDAISDLFITTAGQKTVNQGHISSLIVALPPLAEQTRIATKVNQLMTLCDQIKTQLQAAQHTQAQLAQTITQEALG